MACKQCGCIEGFYKRTPVRGKIVTYYDGNGDYAEENGGMYDNLIYGKEEKNRILYVLPQTIDSKRTR